MGVVNSFTKRNAAWGTEALEACQLKFYAEAA